MSQYDFIIIGGGTSGSVLASRLANSASKPSVLLLEAGDSSPTTADRAVTERFQLAFKPDSKLNWQHKTIEQYGRQIDYSSGRGLGGSTSINFGAFLVGSQEDYNAWARMVDDDAFAWPHVKEVLSRVERCHQDFDACFSGYVQLPERGHGHGPLGLTYGEAISQTIHDRFTAAEQVGWPRNSDLNSGHPIGIGISPACFLNGTRLTASSAYLNEAPDNLTIITGITIARVMPKELMAIGVDGKIYRARKEIILCCGAVKTPQLLMLSGIGDLEELKQHGIEPTHELYQVGKGLQDHCFSSAGVIVKKQDPTPDPDLLFGQRVPSIKGWFKLPKLLSSPEFEALPPETQSYLQKPSVPNWEIAMSAPLNGHRPLQPDESIVYAIALIMNPQSRGQVSLRSSNPPDPPLIDPEYLTHPFDRKAITEAMREMLQCFRAPIFADRTVEHLDWPEDDSDDATLEQVKQNLASSWHLCGTVAMGTCVDSNFRVFGLPMLRVVDMSVCPLLPCNHTQSTAYLIGEIAAEKIGVEYGLDSVGT